MKMLIAALFIIALIGDHLQLSVLGGRLSKLRHIQIMEQNACGVLWTA